MVSWFHPIHLWDIEKPSGFMVSWFRGFMVSSNPSLDDEKPIGFMVSWFCGFVVSWFHGFIQSISLTKEDAGFGIQWTSVVDKA